MNIILDRVTKENKDVLFRLLEYSLFEESSNDGNEMNDEAIFEYKYFDSYFTENDREAFFEMLICHAFFNVLKIFNFFHFSIEFI